MTDSPSSLATVDGHGLIVAATASGTGKTTVALAALRAMARRNISVSSGKVGPDYIDPAFHRAASGAPCMNLDSFAMSDDTLNRIMGHLVSKADYTLIEGVMGLFDGSITGSGSTADIAGRFGLPVLLVVNISGQSDSAGAVVRGFMSHDENVKIAGAVLNQAASARHGDMCRAAVEKTGCPVISVLPREAALTREHRHLGLLQAQENTDLESFLENAANWFEQNTDWPAFLSLFVPPKLESGAQAGGGGFTPLGRRIAVASDVAFSFVYPHLLDRWRSKGAEISFFSPLAGETPDQDADAIYLPGGYPELHAAALSRKSGFFAALRAAADRSVSIFGECGGYMVLGNSLTDTKGRAHPMAGLLPADFTIENPERRLGYRTATLQTPALAESAGARFRAHEFHYASISRTEPYSETLKPLFEIENAKGEHLGAAGHVKGPVSGSFVHLIDKLAD
jgi:cobyrinic acid a,c-diamide synthase